MDLFIGGVHRRKEIVAVAHGLDEHEHGPQRERADGGKGQLGRGVGAGRRTGGEGRQHQRQRGHRHQRCQARPGALDAEELLAVAQPAHQHADAHDPVADDHDRRKDRVARQRGFVRATAQHHREDQGHLDDGDRHRQHQGAERLTQAVGHDLGVVHGGDHRADQCQGREHQDHGPWRG